MEDVKPYLAILATRFQLLLQYRVAAFAGFATQCWWGVMKIFVLAAFFRNVSGAPLTLAQAITYTWLGQAFLGVLPWNIDPDIAQMVETGNVGYERLRPIDTYAYWFARALAWRTATPLLRAIPMFLLAAVTLPLVGLGDWSWRPPDGMSAMLLFICSMTLTILLSSAITTLNHVGVIALRTVGGVNIVNGFITVFSGMVIPLVLLPGAFQPFLFWQPFAGLVEIPYRIYFGNLAGLRALEGLAAQLLWIGVLVVAGRMAMARVMSRIDMQGG
jgi:ABC-2 type transport system permease protein